MNEKLDKQLRDLAELLVTPERYQQVGEAALAPVVQLPLPELARVYQFPEA